MALSADSPQEAADLEAGDDLPFRVLSDPDAGVARAYGLLHARGGPGGKDVALPAHVLLGRDRRIAWRHVAHRIQDRPSPADVLAALDALPR